MSKILRDEHEILRKSGESTLTYDFTVWFWGDAIAMDGLLDAAELLSDDRLRDHCRLFCEKWVWRQFSWVDHLAPGSALLRLRETSEDKDKERVWLDAALRLARWLKEEVPLAPKAHVPLYRPDLPQYRHTVWVDSIYHVPSFFCRLVLRD